MQTLPVDTTEYVLSGSTLSAPHTFCPPQGIIGGDSPLSARGEEYARHLPDQLIDRLPLVSHTQDSANVNHSIIKATSRHEWGQIIFCSLKYPLNPTARRKF